MNPCPSADDWQNWLQANGQVAIADADLESHLETCSSCRKTVDEVVSRDDFAMRSRTALRATGLTSDDWSPSRASLELEETPQESHEGLVSLVRSLLNPSDDEQSLGRLGRFEVLGVIGSGGMGIALKARSLDVNRIVAIKIPQPQYWHAANALQTLEREARSAATVMHPNVISIYHVDRHRDVPYLVMPYLPGQSLQHRLARDGALALAEALPVLRQVASALAAAHACGVVHRDVKPANILLGGATERIVLSDFGLARVQSDVTCTATGTFAGTPIYLSPEQALGQGTGPAGDVYSLGTVLWTMLAGTPPLAGLHAHAIVRLVSESDLPSLSSQPVDAPPWVIRMIELMHQTDPDKRPSAEEVVQWAEQCERHLSGAGMLPDELRRRVGNHGITLAGIGLIAAALMLVAMFFLPWRPWSTSLPEVGERGEKVGLTKAEQIEINELQIELQQLQQETLPQWQAELNAIESSL